MPAVVLTATRAPGNSPDGISGLIRNASVPVIHRRRTADLLPDRQAERETDDGRELVQRTSAVPQLRGEVHDTVNEK